jgi:hypothetical protein
MEEIQTIIGCHIYCEPKFHENIMASIYIYSSFIYPEMSKTKLIIIYTCPFDLPRAHHSLRYPVKALAFDTPTFLSVIANPSVAHSRSTPSARLITGSRKGGSSASETKSSILSDSGVFSGDLQSWFNVSEPTDLRSSSRSSLAPISWKGCSCQSEPHSFQMIRPIWRRQKWQQSRPLR